jgi:hypothetical protein
VDKKGKAIICRNFSNGKRHDFRLFKESGIHIHPKIKSLTDTGTAYQGIHELHQNSALPKKKKESIGKRREKEKS